MAPNRLKAQAATLADGCQRLRAHGAGRNGDLSRRQPPLLGNFQLYSWELTSANMASNKIEMLWDREDIR